MSQKIQNTYQGYFTRGKHFSLWINALLAAFFMLIFFIGLYPGRLVYDTAVNIHRALDGTYSLRHPPFIEAALRLLLSIDKSLFSIFFLQIVTYWTGVFLLSLYFRHKSNWFSLCVIIVAIFPYNIYLHSTIIKDVWIQSSYILFFGLVGTASNTNRLNFFLLSAILLSGMIIILLRNVFVALIPPIGLTISWLILRHHPCKRYVLWISFLTILLSLFFGAVGNFFLVFVTDGKIRNVDHFTRLAGMEVFSMSIRSGHKGVTSKLSDTAKKRTTKAYFGDNIFWKGTVGKEAIILLSKLRSSPEMKAQWKNEIKNRPKLYLFHRLHVFSKLFDGTGESHIRWLKRTKYLGPARLQSSLKRINISEIQPTIVWKVYVRYLTYYFNMIKSNWWLLFLSLIMGIISIIYIAKEKEKWNRDLSLCILMNLCAWSYFGPYLFMLGHAEVRYVYPGLSLILFSIPFFLSFLKGDS